MKDSGLRGLVGRLGRLLGLSGSAPPAAPGAGGAQWESTKGLDEWLDQRLAGTKMRYSRDRPSVRTTRVEEARRRALDRQRLLVLAAVASVVVVGVVLAARAMDDRVVAREVRGLWTTDAPSHLGRRFELRGRMVAFQVDSTGLATRHQVVAVRQSRAGEDGTRYEVTYLSEGEPFTLDFEYRPGPPEVIRLSNQSNIAWRRTTGRSLIPDDLSLP